MTDILLTWQHFENVTEFMYLQLMICGF